MALLVLVGCGRSPALPAPQPDSAAPDGNDREAGAEGACTPTGTEICFDGVDNDCNGLVDCADPSCDPVTECVDAAPGFELGTEVATDAACPPHYTAFQTVLHQGLEAPLACSGCTCSPSLVCAATIEILASCSGAVRRTISVSSDACANDGGAGLGITTGAIRSSAITAEPACAPAGTPTVAPATWRASTSFCATRQLGGGCPMGRVCAARTGGSRHCTLAAGEVACPGNYAPSGGGKPWHAGLEDTRRCGERCGCGAPAGGDCGTSYVRGYIISLDCAGSSDGLVPKLVNCGLDSPIGSARVFQQMTTAPTCAATYSPAGSAAAVDAHTLCCL